MVALVIIVVAVFLVGRPPHSFRIAAGAQGGAYMAFADSLRTDLAERGFNVDITETAGSVDNVALLKSGGADVGIVQSGTDSFVDMSGLTAISELFYEPVWIFYSEAGAPGLSSPQELVGKRVGVGPQGSGTNLLARALLSAFGLDAAAVTMVEAPTSDMLTMLRSGTLDVAFVVASPSAPIITKFALSPGVGIYDYVVTDAISRRYPFLTDVVVPQAVLDIPANVPPHDTRMVGVRATLMAKPGLQSDLGRLLAASVGRVLTYPLVGDPTAFPGLDTTQFPRNQDADLYFKDGPTALEQFLPFDVASPLSRWWVLLLPLLVLAFPIYTIGKATWSWFNTSRIVSWYPRLHWVEQNLDRFSAEQVDVQREFLSNLDASLPNRTRVSAGYLAAYYDLRRTIAFVAERLEIRRQELRNLEASGASPLPDFQEAPPETPELPRTKE
jgi:TRAP transporter TAXI family solute receptor